MFATIFVAVNGACERRRAQRDLRRRERHDRRRVAMHDGIHVGANFIDLAVDEALVINAAPLGIDGIAVEIEFHDVVRRHQRRCERTGHPVAVGITRVAKALRMSTSSHRPLPSFAPEPLRVEGNAQRKSLLPRGAYRSSETARDLRRRCLPPGERLEFADISSGPPAPIGRLLRQSRLLV